MAGDNLVPPHGFQKRFAFVDVVGKRFFGSVGQAHSLDQRFPQGIVCRAGQVIKPIVIAYHVVNANRDRNSLFLGCVAGRAAVSQHGRHLQPGRRWQTAFGRQLPQNGQRRLVALEYRGRDLFDPFDEHRIVGFIPRANVGRGCPLGRANDVENVAEQNNINRFDRPIAAIGPPPGRNRHISYSPGKNRESPLRKRFPGCAVGHV